MKIKSQQDWWAGWMFIAFGAFFILFALGTPEFLDKMIDGRMKVVAWTLEQHCS